MSVDAKIKHQQAPAFVHAKPVQGGLVLSNAKQCSATLASCRSQHAGGRGRCSHIGAAPIEPIDMRQNTLHLRGCGAESP